MSNWLRRLRSVFQGSRPTPKSRLARPGRKTSGPAAPRARPFLENLETRVVPSANDWAQYNYDSSGLRFNTAERTLSARTT